MEKELLQETIYPFTFTLLKFGDSHIVRMTDKCGEVIREKTFNPWANHEDTYQPAIECYDKTIMAAKRMQEEELNTPA